jgi:transposase
MARKPDPKLKSLQQTNSLHPHPDRVSDDLFRASDFFDSRDLVQVKYEMLRRVRVDQASVVETSASFGVSRPTYYDAQAAFDHGGLPGLLSQKRGPRRAHKLSPVVMAYVGESIANDASLRAPELAKLIAQRFDIEIHPRSIERALHRQGKVQKAAGGKASSPRRRHRY